MTFNKNLNVLKRSIKCSEMHMKQDLYIEFKVLVNFSKEN